MAEAFPDIDGKPYRPFEVWRERVFERIASFEPEMLYVAVADGQVIGTILCRIYPETGSGHIWQVAVRRAWRRRNIARNLLSIAFNEYYRRNIRDLTLDVDSYNHTGALELYHRVGMHVRSQVDYIEKEI